MLFRTISEITFLSTPSARRATWGFYALLYTGLISIHALRKEGDDDIAVFCERLRISIHALRKEGDDVYGKLTNQCIISIHALRKEGDCGEGQRMTMTYNFYPRPPQGGRLPQTSSKTRWTKISIHALRKEGD